MHAELVAEPAARVDLERVLAREEPALEVRLDVLEVGEVYDRPRLDAVRVHERHVLVVLRRVRREVGAGDGEHVRPGDDVVDERRLVEHCVDRGLRALRVVHGEDRREQGLERIHLHRLDGEVVDSLDPRAAEALERALDVVAYGRDPVEVRDVAPALVLPYELRERQEHGADGGGLEAGALRAVFVGLAAGHRAVVLHEAPVEGCAGNVARSLHRNELHCHFLFPFFFVLGSWFVGLLVVGLLVCWWLVCWLVGSLATR